MSSVNPDLPNYNVGNSNSSWEDAFMSSLKWINTIAFLAMIGVNIAANLIPIGGNTTGDVSKAYPNLFTPAPITFAIWGVIYFMMLLFVIYQWGFIGSAKYTDAVRSSTGVFFATSCAINIAWIFAWHMQKIELSTLFIVLLLVNLIIITKKLNAIPISFLNSLMVKVGFDIYFGWIIAATIANISVMLTKMNWDGFGLSEVTWTIIILLVGALIGAAVVFLDNRHFAGLAIIWAYIGIMIKHISDLGYSGRYNSIIITSAVGISIILCVILLRVIVPAQKVSSDFG